VNATFVPIVVMRWSMELTKINPKIVGPRGGYNAAPLHMMPVITGIGNQTMKIRIPFAWSAAAVTLFIHAVVSLVCCVSKCGWIWYGSFVLSVGGFMYSVQMWNYTADTK
jgi:hypothetical protein